VSRVVAVAGVCDRTRHGPEPGARAWGRRCATRLRDG
jgi:hypothetical protein